jgi:hypothetical protein
MGRHIAYSCKKLDCVADLARELAGQPLAGVPGGQPSSADRQLDHLPERPPGRLSPRPQTLLAQLRLKATGRRRDPGLQGAANEDQRCAPAPSGRTSLRFLIQLARDSHELAYGAPREGDAHLAHLRPGVARHRVMSHGKSAKQRPDRHLRMARAYSQRGLHRAARPASNSLAASAS